MSYKAVVQNYTYNFQPPDIGTRPQDMSLYVDDELRRVSRSILSLTDAVSEIQSGTASGKTVTLQPTGVKAGVYRNVTLTIGTDGRITAVESASSSTVFPKGGSSGQFLATDGNGGVFWKTPPAASSSGGVSSGGGGGGSSSVTVPKAIDSADLKATANASTFTFALKPTGITAGHYTNADLTVDAAGRVTSIASGVAVPPVFTSQTWQAADTSIWTVMMSNAGVLTTTLSTAADSVTAQDGRTMISTEDGSDYIAF